MIGIDLVKTVVQACIIDRHGELVSNKAMSPQRLKNYLPRQPPQLLQWKAVGPVTAGVDL